MVVVCHRGRFTLTSSVFHRSLPQFIKVILAEDSGFPCGKVSTARIRLCCVIDEDGGAIQNNRAIHHFVINFSLGCRLPPLLNRSCFA
jgi:hypothetical protein